MSPKKAPKRLSKTTTDPKEKADDSKKWVKALKNVLVEGKSCRAVAAAHSLPRTNLRRYIKRAKGIFNDFATVTDDEWLGLLNEVTSHNSNLVTT